MNRYKIEVKGWDSAAKRVNTYVMSAKYGNTCKALVRGCIERDESVRVYDRVTDSYIEGFEYAGAYERAIDRLYEYTDDVWDYGFCIAPVVINGENRECLGWWTCRDWYTGEYSDAERERRFDEFQREWADVTDVCVQMEIAGYEWSAVVSTCARYVME